jgi:hypothetical protein
MYAEFIVKYMSNDLLSGEQNGFRQWPFCVGVVFVVKQIIEEILEFNLGTVVAFVVYEDVIYSVNRGTMRDI